MEFSSVSHASTDFCSHRLGSIGIEQVEHQSWCLVQEVQQRRVRSTQIGPFETVPGLRSWDGKDGDADAVHDPATCPRGVGGASNSWCSYERLQSLPNPPALQGSRSVHWRGACGHVSAHDRMTWHHAAVHLVPSRIDIWPSEISTLHSVSTALF